MFLKLCFARPNDLQDHRPKKPEVEDLSSSVISKTKMRHSTDPLKPMARKTIQISGFCFPTPGPRVTHPLVKKSRLNLRGIICTDVISQDQSDISQCICDFTLLNTTSTGCSLPREKCLHSVAPQILPKLASMPM